MQKSNDFLCRLVHISNTLLHAKTMMIKVRCVCQTHTRSAYKCVLFVPLCNLAVRTVPTGLTKISQYCLVMSMSYVHNAFLLNDYIIPITPSYKIE